jgi:hypothetical protein
MPDSISLSLQPCFLLSQSEETVSQVRSWFDRLTTNGPCTININDFAIRPECFEGRTVNYDTVSTGGGIEKVGHDQSFI